MNAQAPSEPPPKHASLAVYAEHVDCAMQVTPFDTHFEPTPIIAVEQDALVVPMMSEHYFNLQAVVVLAGVVAVAAVVVV